MPDIFNQILHQITTNPGDNIRGIIIILVLLAIAFKLAPKGVSSAGHDAGQLFLLAALPLFFIDFATSAEYAAGELHHLLGQSNLQDYTTYPVFFVALLYILFVRVYIFSLWVFL